MSNGVPVPKKQTSIAGISFKLVISKAKVKRQAVSSKKVGNGSEGQNLDIMIYIYIYTRFWSLDIIFENLQNGYGPGAWVNNCQTIRSGGSISTGHEYWIVLNHMTDYAAFGGFSKPQVLDIFAGRRCPKFPLVKFLQTWVETSHILESWRYMISMLIPSQPLTFKDTMALDALVAPRMTSCDPELGLGHGFVGALAMIYTMYIVRWSSIQGKSIRTRPWWGG